jgi:hypothetical protein
MSHSAKLNFIKQQGFISSCGPACEMQYTALMFQPRLIGGFVILSLIFQSWLFFFDHSCPSLVECFRSRLEPF